MILYCVLIVNIYNSRPHNFIRLLFRFTLNERAPRICSSVYKRMVVVEHFFLVFLFLLPKIIKHQYFNIYDRMQKWYSCLRIWRQVELVEWSIWSEIMICFLAWSQSNLMGFEIRKIKCWNMSLRHLVQSSSIRSRL